jgi:hypothetical protein
VEPRAKRDIKETTAAGRKKTPTAQDNAVGKPPHQSRLYGHKSGRISRKLAKPLELTMM